MKNLFWRLNFAVFAGILCGVGSANQLKVLSLDEKVAQSEVVVIGTVIAVDLPGSKPESSEKYAVIEVAQTLKGNPGRNFNFQYRGSIAEQNPDCCIIGKSYLLFLRKIEGSNYVSVNHSFGVYTLPQGK